MFDIHLTRKEKVVVTGSSGYLGRALVGYLQDRSIDVLVSRLRNKLGETPNNVQFIKTIHGVGYKFIGTPKN